MSKYKARESVNLTSRKWPSKELVIAPFWLSTDLRDGNQALFEPLSIEAKVKMFLILTKMGFKEIEISFPSASASEFDFTRKLIEENLIPEDVAISVLTQARAELIEKTMQSVSGAREAIVHVYNATSDTFMNYVFNQSESKTIKLASDAVDQIKAYAGKSPSTKWRLEYSAESFSDTRLGFAKEICDEVSARWGASPQNKVIINLPATVELCMPNQYADKMSG